MFRYLVKIGANYYYIHNSMDFSVWTELFCWAILENVYLVKIRFVSSPGDNKWFQLLEGLISEADEFYI